MLILTPSAFSLNPAQAAGTQLDWVRSSDGRTVQEQGRCAAALLPRDDDCVLVLPPLAVSWHRLSLPKVAPNRLRAVLDGLLEESLLGDITEQHLALAPGGKPGQAVWVAAIRKAWLQSWLQMLEAAQRPVSRIVPALWPASEPVLWVHQQADQPWVLSVGEAGVSCLPLHGFPAAQGLLQSAAHSDAASHPVGWVEPALAAQAESLLAGRLGLCARAEWLLRCGQTDGSLAQFEFSLSDAARRGQRLRRAWRDIRGAPAWRPARWGLAVLLVVQLLGLNAWAWQTQRLLEAKERRLGEVLQAHFPDVSLVLDAPVQMQRELARMRGASGALSSSDLEAQLAGLAAVGVAPGVSLAAVEFSPTETRLQLRENLGASWPEWQAALARAGWQASWIDNTLSLRSTDAPPPAR